MKISIVIGALLIGLIAISYIVLAPEHGDGQGPDIHAVKSRPESGNDKNGEVELLQATIAQSKEASDERHRNDMREAFSTLQQSRKQLRSRANLIKSKIWGLELPSQQAKAVSKKLRRVFAYLKNPPMLGAYFEVKEIQSEVKKVMALQEGLNEVEHLIRASQTNNS